MFLLIETKLHKFSKFVLIVIHNINSQFHLTHSWNKLSAWTFNPFWVSVSVLSLTEKTGFGPWLLRTRTDRCKGVSIKVKLMGKYSAKLMQLLSTFAGSGHISLKIGPYYCKDYKVPCLCSGKVICFSNRNSYKKNPLSITSSSMIILAF